MIIMKYNYIYIALLFMSCNNYIENNNDPKDILEAKSLTSEFYRDMSDGHREEIYKMCTDSSSIEDFKSLFHAKDSILGEMLQFEIINVNTTNVESEEINQVKYSIELNVKYQKGDNRELVEFVKNESNKKILESYHFEPYE